MNDKQSLQIGVSTVKGFLAAMDEHLRTSEKYPSHMRIAQTEITFNYKKAPGEMVPVMTVDITRPCSGIIADEEKIKAFKIKALNLLEMKRVSMGVLW